MTFSTLKSTVAVIALTASAAIAQQQAEDSADPGAASEMTKAETHSEDAVESAGETLEAAGDATSDAADATVEGVENAADATGEAVEDAAEATTDAAGNAVDEAQEMASDAAEATEEAADAAETELSQDTAETSGTQMTDDATDMTATDDALHASISGMTVGDLLGKDVIEANGEEIGEIDYVVMEEGKLSAVIGIGGFLGLGEYTVAIPVNEFQAAPDNADALKLTRWTETELENQPEFDETGAESLPEETPVSSEM
jgi:sporulation protein YlmC with PRC-barrel domain